MTLSYRLVLAIHQDQIETYGGESGVRDVAALESALAQPELEVFGQVLHPSLELKAAAYLYHLVKNHPFIDGNKRVAWAVTETFLLLNGFELSMSDNEAYILTTETAKGSFTKEAIAEQLRAHLVPS